MQPILKASLIPLASRGQHQILISPKSCVNLLWSIPVRQAQAALLCLLASCLKGVDGWMDGSFYTLVCSVHVKNPPRGCDCGTFLCVFLLVHSERGSGTASGSREMKVKDLRCQERRRLFTKDLVSS